MKYTSCLMLATALLLTGPGLRASDTFDRHAFVEEQYRFAAQQYDGLLRRAADHQGLPRTFVNGELVFTEPRGWTSGFFPGSLWLLHEHTGEDRWKKAASDYTSRLEAIKDFAGHHDIGFMLYCSYGHGYRLTQDPAYREVLLEGAATLCTRFSPKVGLIRSWDDARWKYPVIIDNMMNLELLMFAYTETKTPSFRNVAVSHADRTLHHFFRSDVSSFHVVDFDPESGTVLRRQTAQGYRDDSAWARGQAWGLYGFTMMHRFTRKPEYRQQAVRIAEFVLGHTNLPGDKVPYWDFNAPGIPDEPRDASSAAIMASALLELSTMVQGPDHLRYHQFAEAQLKSLASPHYRAGVNKNGNFLLKHSVGSMPRKSEVDVPLIYADYYFLEALARLKDK